ncbi:MAG: polyprenyl synthetase family protein [Solirubrobacteraceae bacterium]
MAVDPVAAIAVLGGERMAGRMGAVEARLREICAPSDDALGTVEAGGKRLRPLIVFVAGFDGPDDAPLVRGAVAVELVHSATLVHDDVLDAAPLRRGRPTVFSEGGRDAATATGDLLFSRAFAELAANGSVEQLRVLSAASSSLARGELVQREDAWCAEVSVERYLRRCELKTASLFEAACQLGALAAGSVALVGFGRAIGVAFQILDDVLDVTGPPERTGKARGTDLLDGTVTLPLILARERDPVLAGLDLRAIEDAAGVCVRIVATGAVDVARERALALVAAAKAELPESIGAAQRRALELVADGVVDRYA